MRTLTDEELYAEILKTPDKAFRPLYDRHSGPLFRFIYRFTLNTEAAEEIVQDIFTSLLEGRYQPGAGANLKSWLYTVAKNKSLNRAKKVSFEVNNDVAMEAAPVNEDMEAELVQKKLLHQLIFAEGKLPEDLRQTWNLRKQGLDYQQIADSLSIPLGTVKSRFHRLVEHLKKEFGNGF